MTGARRGVWIGAGFFLAFLAAHVVLVAAGDFPGRLAVLEAMSIGAALAAAGLCGAAALKAGSGFVRWYWGLLGLAELCTVAAGILWAVYELALDSPAPYPSLADAAWLAYYPVAFAGVMRLSVARHNKRGIETISSLDALLVSLAGTALAWEFLMAPALGRHTTPLASLTSIAYPLGDLLLLGALVSLVLSRRRRQLPRGTLAVVAGFIVGIVADVAYTQMIIAGTYATGIWVEPLWALGHALIGVAALVYLDARARGLTVESEPGSILVVTRAGIAQLVHRSSPFVAVVVAGFISYYHFVTRSGGTPVEDVVVVVISTLTPIIVLARQAFVSHENRRLHASLVEAAHALEERVAERTQELAAEKERLGVLNQVAREISNCTSVDEVIAAGTRFLRRATHCASVAISASGQRGGLHFSAAGSVSPEGALQLRKTLRRYLLSNADSTDETPFLLDFSGSRDGGNGQAPQYQGPFVGIMMFPMISRQTLLGTACLARDCDDCRLSQDELDMVENILSQVTVALEGACRYDDARFLADNDALTGLANRRTINERLAHEVARSERTQSSFCVIMMDVDNFKYFNDTYGHAVGDRVLSTTATALMEAVRGCDLLGRYGGDEFLAILPETDLEGAARVVERIGACLAERPVAVARMSPIPLHVSCGLATYPAHGRAPDELLRVADANMYQTKRGKASSPPDPSVLPDLGERILIEADDLA